MRCPVCWRVLVTRKVDKFVYACEGCGTYFSGISHAVIDEGLTHCRCCHTLIAKPLSIDGYGIACGCAKLVYNELKKFAADAGYHIEY